MDKLRFLQRRKSNLNLKQVRKYALERFKHLHEQRLLVQQIQLQKRQQKQQEQQQRQQQRKEKEKDKQKFETNSEAGTSLTSASVYLVKPPPLPLKPSTPTKATGAICKRQQPQPQQQRKQNKLNKHKDEDETDELFSQTSHDFALKRFKKAQYQHTLHTHQYADVEHLSVKVKIMNNNETKPLTPPNYAQVPKRPPIYNVHREVLTHEVVIKRTGYVARDKSIPSALRGCWQSCSFLSLFTGVLPILQWLPKYSLKRDLLGDVIAGITVAIMNIPHGMAYGILAGVSPSSGLYMAVFPVLIYMIFGTSRHISIGTFAVASMMTLKVVQTYATEEVSEEQMANNATNATTPAPVEQDVITPLEVVTALAFTVGAMNLAMAFLRLGTLAALLSDPLVSGFTTGAAFHVVVSQFKEVLGVTVPRYKSVFKIIYTIIDVCIAVPQTNLAAFIFCMGIMVFMTICNEWLKPRLRKCCRFPFPAELISVIGGTLISKFMNLNDKYNVSLVGVIPSGLPMPEAPRFDLVPKVALDSIAIAIVTYSIIMSMGLTFAKKHSYEIRANQELFAMGVGNMVSSCFACIPMACSLSRSVIQDQTGGATQIASLVSAGLIVITILWAGPFFSDLPRCVLAGVIIVALKPLFMQMKDLKKFSKQGKLELLTWIVTFLGVVIIDIDIGLFIGIGVSLLTLYIKGLKPYSTLLGFLPEAQAIYVDISQHHNAIEVPETKIFRYCGSLNFATGIFYRRALYAAIGLDKKKRTFTSPKKHPNGNAPLNGETTRLNGYRILILDFSMLGHIDVAGCSTLNDINKEMNSRGVRMLLSSPADRVYDTLVHSMALGEGPFEVFPTLHDTVTYANACRTA